MERNAGSRSDRLEGKEEAATRLDKAEAYSRVVGMTCQDVAQSLSGKDDLAAIVPLLLHHRLDGEGLLQVTTMTLVKQSRRAASVPCRK